MVIQRSFIMKSKFHKPRTDLCATSTAYMESRDGGAQVLKFLPNPASDQLDVSICRSLYRMDIYKLYVCKGIHVISNSRGKWHFYSRSHRIP
ncbi:hypothetical protein CDAR_258971 [Caerostris darwini]|uniref:Uncharacterized protein n=1 Tax=Caerostris darwini TaxID=1538125 RepID=A0AAV4PST0_9ARAC|nr:hypothetical protein CDAR_258971 [Caerostris darwini]